jgi:hypothetical protein
MFMPWKGKYWGLPDNALAGRKVLLLGESHYAAEGDGALVGKTDAGGTLKTFEEYVLGSKTIAFFTKLLQTVAGRKKWEMTAEEIRAVWDSVVFYNYVPVYAAPGPRASPTNEMFEMGAAPFETVVERYRPEVIVVCGDRLWWWLLKGRKFEKDPYSLGTFQIGGALAMRMKHPSTAFSSERWHAVLQNHLVLSRHARLRS